MKMTDVRGNEWLSQRGTVTQRQQWLIILDATPPTNEYRYPSAITTEPVACRKHPHNTLKSRAFQLSSRLVAADFTHTHDINKRDAGPPMTSVYSRSPLHLINMQSTQRPSRRRTTRHLFNDEDEPPAKRSKLEENTAANGGPKQANGKAPASKVKRPKRSYDEDADGFQFTRKTRSKVDEPAPAATQAPEPSRTRETAATKRKKDSMLYSGSSETEQAGNRRRSARLSSDKDSLPRPKAPVAKPSRTRKLDEHKTAPDKPKATKISKSDPPPSRRLDSDREDSPDVAPTGLHVEKPRDGTKIALPFADTPVIRRNKEMRQQTKSKHRRSSTGLRGRRASSLIESGTSNGRIIHTYGTKYISKSASKVIRFSSLFSEAESDPQCDDDDDLQTEEQFTNDFLDYVAVPHADVAITDFYKHIEQSLPEPRRMKQLLTWCGTRALPEKAHGGTGDAGEMLAKDSARHISEELLKDFANKAEMSDWFSREDGPVEEDVSVVKKPNPRNIRNAEKLKELEEEIARLQSEKQSWEGLLSTKSPPEIQPSDPGKLDPELLDPAQATILATLQASSTSTTSTTTTVPTKSSQNETHSALPISPPTLSSRVNTIVDTLEPQIDLFADGIHKISQYRLAAERVADKVLGSTADNLESRDRMAKEASGTAGVGAREVLSALGGALSGSER
ncbi:hypothetical protein FKW77_005632 [Venturia effusa]|uniref:Kinetochore protein mis13 n=1 Tax=Venturia effusa TaxID=50376 RepID=A0A517LNZ8_9PEZI|nr:hypothetical protein FKW77_005632 [Venturia effusa]